MTIADIPAVAHLFLTVFRGTDTAASDDFVDYLKQLLFDCPGYRVSDGSLVYEQADAAIGAALLAVPMRYVAFDRPVTGRLLFAFMARPGDRSNGAARMTLTVRTRTDAFAFSDSASPTSRRHWKAIGAMDLPVHGLEWRRSFRPLGSVCRFAEGRVRGLRLLGLPFLARVVDAPLRWMLPRYAAPEVTGISDAEMTPAQFVVEAPRLVAHYAVRPAWSPDELSWILHMAAQNTTAGPLRIRAVRDGAGTLVGCFVYYGAAGRTARILDVLPAQGREAEVVGAMFRHLDRAGCVGAVGRVVPALLVALAGQRATTFRHDAFVCLSTARSDISDAVQRGDIYIGGLAGEAWSRLMSDFR